MRGSSPIRLNVSELQDFMRCKYRWYAKWVLNRVPRVTPTPLTLGKLVHTIFEDHLSLGKPMGDAIIHRRREFLDGLADVHDPYAISNAHEAIAILDGMDEALRQWRDDYVMDVPALEVEESFSYPDKELGIEWIGRPDRVSVDSSGRMWHNQVKNLAAGVNFAVFLDLQQRSYHEHLYGEALAAKYPEYKYGGTMFTLIRKVKYRTGVTKANPDGKVKPLSEMFWQSPMAIDLTSWHHNDVMSSLRANARELLDAREQYSKYGRIPPPNELANGGPFGNSPDLYFRVLTGDALLSDDNLFMDREDTYNKENSNAEEVNAAS